MFTAKSRISALLRCTYLAGEEIELLAVDSLRDWETKVFLRCISPPRVLSLELVPEVCVSDVILLLAIIALI